jgi:ABC-type polysaccharide/polyol phosphate transport system ATPase subunit
MKKNNNLAVKLINLSKTYQLHHEKPTLMENIFRRNGKEMFTALKEINLEIKRGEKVGIIGSNGSGKTTLLKIISGISTPTKGSIKTWGKLVSLIDLSAGFHPELTGRENIFLNSLLVGMGREEVRKKYNEIVEFADIGDFIDAPLYTYSSGMNLRLGFSIAVAADPDILILDEGLGVGDRDFQKKSANKIEDFFKQKKTIILVSHWLEYLNDHCQRIVWLENGKIKMDGNLKILDKYKRNI